MIDNLRHYQFNDQRPAVTPTKTAFTLTLDQYEKLSAEYLKEFQQVYKGGEFDPALLLSDFLLWLKKKERQCDDQS